MSLLKKRDARLFCKLCGEMNDLYHELTLKSGITESVFAVFYGIAVLGDGCLQKDICDEFYANKQTINVSVRKLKQTGYLYLEPGKGRDKHIRLTDLGKQFVEKIFFPLFKWKMWRLSLCQKPNKHSCSVWQSAIWWGSDGKLKSCDTYALSTFKSY